MARWFRTAACAAALAATVGAATAGAASAEPAFPSKPVHIFVPYAAGGAVDVLTRTLGDVVSKHGASRWWSKTVRVPAA
jgi:tripartite-type tricarboxylate transporter receptor subunit TctC